MGETGLIYRITCLENGRFYIGSTANLAVRKRHHWYLLRSGRHHSRHLQRCFNRYGEAAIMFSVEREAVPMRELLAIEGEMISVLRPEFNGSHISASRLGTKHSEASLMKMRSAQLGRKHTAEARAKIGAALRGNDYAIGNSNRRKVTPEMRARIHALVVDGIGSYRIAKIVGVSKKTIINVRHGRH